jgi:hypothetical protein
MRPPILPRINADERGCVHPDEEAYRHSELTDRIIIKVFHNVYNEGTISTSGFCQ